MARHLSPTRARRQPPAVYPLPIDCSTVGFLPETNTLHHDTIPMSAAACPLAHLEDHGLLKAEGLVNSGWTAGDMRFWGEDPETGQALVQVANLGPARAEEALG